MNVEKWQISSFRISDSMSKNMKLDKAKELYWEEVGGKSQKVKVLICGFREFVFATWTVERGPLQIFNRQMVRSELCLWKQTRGGIL